MNATKPSTGSALVVYESMFGCTEQVARAIGDGLATEVHAQVQDVRHGPLRPEEAPALLVIGGPTHAFSMSRDSTRLNAVAQGARTERDEVGIREWIARLPAAGDHPATAVATFDTKMHGARLVPGSAARAARQRLRRLGYPIAAKPRTFLVNGMQGPLADGELDAARAWGARLGKTLAAGFGGIALGPGRRS